MNECLCLYRKFKFQIEAWKSIGLKEFRNEMRTKAFELKIIYSSLILIVVLRGLLIEIQRIHEIQ